MRNERTRSRRHRRCLRTACTSFARLKSYPDCAICQLRSCRWPRKTLTPPPSRIMIILRNSSAIFVISADEDSNSPMRVAYSRAVGIARGNRRVRPVVDGLVAAMAHLWSKFTKCLRPSEGVFDPRPCHPRMPVLRAHNAASFAIITSSLSPPRGGNEVLVPISLSLSLSLSSSIARSSARSSRFFLLPRPSLCSAAEIRVFHFAAIEPGESAHKE